MPPVNMDSDKNKSTLTTMFNWAVNIFRKYPIQASCYTALAACGLLGGIIIGDSLPDPDICDRLILLFAGAAIGLYAAGISWAGKKLALEILKDMEKFNDKAEKERETKKPGAAEPKPELK